MLLVAWATCAGCRRTPDPNAEALEAANEAAFSEWFHAKFQPKNVELLAVKYSVPPAVVRTILDRFQPSLAEELGIPFSSIEEANAFRKSIGGTNVTARITESAREFSVSPQVVASIVIDAMMLSEIRSP